ncbi:hypothetical protein K504DRAFT_460734 [Pleomassaria siparia CBS 279.74]|uniref:Nephrocystin 3-like N-terminal domain-containing protein n=1 Tax=Pleomassaria siparia CBS 279.74 TaxID=1314801 RepID=A0A6G1JWM6_9PLEO|nr:hypothetical protein K504DRAFT_460734 [Pleomassaria siparia CBS 279.74]
MNTRQTTAPEREASFHSSSGISAPDRVANKRAHDIPDGYRSTKRSKPTYSAEDYTIGCICALDIESVALRSFLDEEHESLQEAASEDHNSYILGRMGRHNVVIAVLPGECGTASASGVAKDMLHTFTHLKVGFMVGIGGGAPTKDRDIRLGDVVVSYPESGHGGVYQYDFGKHIQDEDFIATGFLDKPPELLRAAVAALRSDYMINGHDLYKSIEDILEKNKRLRKSFNRPPRSSDNLFMSNFVHDNSNKHQKQTCAEICIGDGATILERNERTEDDDNPAVHYGLIASANQVMRDATFRDTLARKKNVLCFEMEAAGLMNHFPCLVIRGIADYADTHKNDQWHGYAAMTAAAFTKDIILRLIPNKVASEKRIVEVLSGIEELAKAYSEEMILQEQQRVLKWLTEIDFSSQQNSLNKQRQPETAEWFLEIKPFKDWLSIKGKVLFCPGIPGAGKTFITSRAIQHLQTTFSLESKVATAYIYCNYREVDSQSLDDLLMALLKQFTDQCRPFPESVKAVYSQHAKSKSRPLLKSITTMLHSVISSLTRAFIVVDGLDECQLENQTREKFIDTLFSVQKVSQANLLVTSRFNTHIEKRFKDHTPIVIKATDEDVGLYLDAHILHSLQFVSNVQDLGQRIKEKIQNASNGMFLLAKLHLNSLKGLVNVRQVKDALRHITSGETALEAAYEKTMHLVEGQQEHYRDIALQALAWIAFSDERIGLQELQYALGIEVGMASLDMDNLASTDLILSACAGLITIQPRGPSKDYDAVMLAHKTTHDFLKRTSGRWFKQPGLLIFRKCSTYLSFDVFSDGPCETKELYEARLAAHPFYHYAVREWSSQSQKVSRTIRSDECLLKKLLLSDPHIASYAQAKKAHSPRSFRRPRIGMSTGLHLAVRFGWDDLIPYLIHLIHYRRDSWDEDGLTALHLAIDRSHVEIVRLLLSMPEVDCNALNSSGDSPLTYAIMRSREKVFKIMVSSPKVQINGVGIHESNIFVRTAFTSELLSTNVSQSGTGPKLDIQSAQKRTVIPAREGDSSRIPESEDAANITNKSSHAEVQLYDLCVRPKIGKSSIGRLPLQMAIVYGDKHALELLLKRPEIDLHRCAPTIITIAINIGPADLVLFLLSNLKEYLNLGAEYLLGVIELSAGAGHVTVVERLLHIYHELAPPEDGADGTTLQKTSWNSVSVIELLSSVNMENLNDRDSFGQTRSLAAAKTGRKANFFILLAMGAYLSIDDNLGNGIDWYMSSRDKAVPSRSLWSYCVRINRVSEPVQLLESRDGY